VCEDECSQEFHIECDYNVLWPQIERRGMENVGVPRPWVLLFEYLSHSFLASEPYDSRPGSMPTLRQRIAGF
jgi:hypothetical protein